MSHKTEANNVGTTTSLNDQPGTGLYWVTDVQGFNLRVYNAVPQGGTLNLLRSFNIDGVTKFTRPVFGNGIVYVATTQGMLYAIGSPVNPPLLCSSPYDFGQQITGQESAPMTISCQAVIDTQITGAVLTSTANFQLTSVPTLPVSIAQGQNFTFRAVFGPLSAGSLSDDVYLNTTNSQGGYSTQTPVSLSGTGDSQAPLLSTLPNTVSFPAVVLGQAPGGINSTLILLNMGDSPLNVTSYDFSLIAEN